MTRSGISASRIDPSCPQPLLAQRYQTDLVIQRSDLPPTRQGVTIAANMLSKSAAMRPAMSATIRDPCVEYEGCTCLDAAERP